MPLNIKLSYNLNLPCLSIGLKNIEFITPYDGFLKTVLKLLIQMQHWKNLLHDCLWNAWITSNVCQLAGNHCFPKESKAEEQPRNLQDGYSIIRSNFWFIHPTFCNRFMELGVA